MAELAVATQIAEQVYNRLYNAQNGELVVDQFDLERSYAEWDLDLTNIDRAELRDEEKLFVDVVAHTTEQQVEANTRGGSVRFTVPIDIAIRRKFGQDKQDPTTGRIAIEHIDQLVLLTQQIYLLFLQQRLSTTNFPYTVWDAEKGGTSIVVCPIKDHLRNMRQFTSIVRTYLRADAKPSEV